jgi:flagellar basal-body rod modification protein FlgD
MVTAVSNTTNTTSTSTATGSMDTSATQDRFLKLLVAQLNNQDPMNPMDNAQMTTQLAQINTVSGIEKLNQTVSSMVDQFSALQMMQGANLVGHEVVASGSTLTKNGTKGVGALSLTESASSVTVEVSNANGAVVDTIKLGALAAGRHDFVSDLSKYVSTGNLSFKVTAVNGTQAVEATPLIRDKVTSVSTGTSGLQIGLANSPSVAYSAVQAVL